MDETPEINSQVVLARKAIWQRVLRDLSRNPEPLSVKGFVGLLRAAGLSIEESTPPKWATRGIPSEVAILIAGLPQAKEKGLTAEYLTGRGVGESAPAGSPVELRSLMGLVRDALLGAVDRALARDHELEQTRRGYRILGDAFLDLGLKLQSNGVDTHELLTYARELQKQGEP